MIQLDENPPEMIPFRMTVCMPRGFGHCEKCVLITVCPCSAARLVATAGVEPDGVGGLHLWILNESNGEPTDGKAEQSPVTFIQALGGKTATGHVLEQ